MASPTVANYLASARRLREGVHEIPGLARLRLAILRSYTVEPLIPYLEVECALAGIGLELFVGDYGTYRQEILDPRSGLYAFDPRAVLLLVDRDELAPGLTRDFLLRDAHEIREAQVATVADLTALAETFRANSDATLILQTLIPPARSPAGLADGRLRPGQREAFRQLNLDIFRIADSLPGTEVFDLDAHVAMVGYEQWEDPRLALLARTPVAAGHLPGLAAAYARMLAIVANVRRKCVVLDLDNTLWGGVVGEEGWQAVHIGADYPGSAFVAFQRALLDLQQRGILLALASKNEPTDVDAVFRRSEMVLRLDDFAARRINWRDKATSIREISEELGFGLDTFVFIDDNAAERELVRQMLPEVLVPEWPAEPARYVEALHGIASLDCLRITAEDRARADLYRREVRRAESRVASRSLEEFHHSLGMRASVDRANAATVSRIAQLTQKTNQFNLTLRRYSEAEIAALASSPSHDVEVFGLRDRFGDSGHVAVAILAFEGAVARIDSLLMSCRVLGRGFETFLLAHLVISARAHGASRLEGRFVPGPRNSQVADLYPRHGFHADGSETGCWYLDLSRDTLEGPAWIEYAAPRVVPVAS